MNPPIPDLATRIAVMGSSMLGTMLVMIDGTIANVALPHMQASVMASQDQIVWVLTSYLIAAAVATPLSGWLANRYGRKRVMITSVVLFTAASAACGLSTNLEELVLFRLIQGVSGASIVPLTQSLLLDINPPEQHGIAMSIYGMGSLLGPVIGPTVGGWLTDNLTWRWVFFINVPLGVLAFFGMSAFMSETHSRRFARFDFLGFAALGIFLACLQLVLDRGQQLDWFNSWEIRAEAIGAVFFLYILIVHTLTTRDPFVKPGLFRDSNFLLGSVVAMMLGVVIYGVATLLVPMLERLMGYPVMLTGLVTAPRGIGSIIGMLASGLLISRVDPRLMIGGGLALSSLALFQLSHVALSMDSSLVMTSCFLQGIGGGMVFVPLSTVIFSTMEPHLRNEGTSMYALTRSLGSSIGISLLQTVYSRGTTRSYARLVEGVRPDNPALNFRAPMVDLGDPRTAAMAQHEIQRQAEMVSYSSTYSSLAIAAAVAIIFVAVMRFGKKPAAVDRPVRTAVD
jgi:DHA2 family multidrug resistance protein